MTPRRECRLIAAHGGAVFGWGFMTLWLGFLLIFTYLYFRDGAPPGSAHYFPWVLALFWLFGGAGAWHFYALPRIEVRLDASRGALVVYEVWLWRERAELAGGAAPAVEASTDSDGDVSYGCWIETATGRRLCVTSSIVREPVEQARQRLLAAVAKREGRS